MQHYGPRIPLPVAPPREPAVPSPALATHLARCDLLRRIAGKVVVPRRNAALRCDIRTPEGMRLAERLGHALRVLSSGRI